MTPAFKKHITTLVTYFQNAVLASEYEIDISFSKEDDSDKPNAAASIRTDEVYLNATITVRPMVFRMWEEKEYSEIAQTICHECCHILTEPLYAVGLQAVNNTNRGALEEIRERQTERISKSLFRLTPRRAWLPAKQ